VKLATYVVVLVAIARIAAAEPAPRLVLADRDAELRRAVEVALRPWHVEIVDKWEAAGVSLEDARDESVERTVEVNTAAVLVVTPPAISEA